MKKKIVAIMLCMGMLTASVVGTMAYLTDQENVTNTFTVGKVGLKLDEADVKPDGTYETAHDTRVDGNEYHLLPGHTYIKDPTVTVLKDSEDCYVRMIVTVENIDQLRKALPKAETVVGEDGTFTEITFPENQKYYGDDDTFLLQMLCGNWDSTIWKFEKYSEETVRVDDASNTEMKLGLYEFRYKDVVIKNTGNDTVLDDLFETITVPGEIDHEHLAYLENVKIKVTAHAIQKDGFKDADEAWNCFK